MSRYVLAVDQSTQGTKGLLFDEDGVLVCRADRPHRQIISELGWVSHDPEEIRENTLGVCRDTVEKAGIRFFASSNVSTTRPRFPRETSLYKPGLPEIAKIVSNIILSYILFFKTVAKISHQHLLIKISLLKKLNLHTGFRHNPPQHLLQPPFHIRVPVIINDVVRLGATFLVRHLGCHTGFHRLL